MKPNIYRGTGSKGNARRYLSVNEGAWTGSFVVVRASCVLDKGVIKVCTAQCRNANSNLLAPIGGKIKKFVSIFSAHFKVGFSVITGPPRSINWPVSLPGASVNFNYSVVGQLSVIIGRYFFSKNWL